MSQHTEWSTQQLVHVQRQHGARLAQVDPFQALEGFLQRGGLRFERRRDMTAEGFARWKEQFKNANPPFLRQRKLATAGTRETYS